MPIIVYCDNCNKELGHLRYVKGEGIGFDHDVRHVTRKSEKHPDGFVTVCSKECAMLLDAKEGRNTSASSMAKIDAEFGEGATA